MFYPLATCMGLRYTRAKKRSHFVSFISLTSMLGIALGVCVLITVLSVMNGFDEEINKRFFNMAPEVIVNDMNGRMQNWPALRKQLLQEPDIINAAPYVGSQGLLTANGRVLPASVTGILPKLEAHITGIEKSMLTGKLTALKSGEFGIIIGQGMSVHLGLKLGDKVRLLIPDASVSPAGVLPRFKTFTVVGIFSAGPGSSFNKSVSFIQLQDAQKLMMLGEGVTGLRARINNIFLAPQLAHALEMKLPSVFASDWTQQFGALFNAIKLEKTMMFLILTLIIAVAAFNLVSSLVMIVNDKRAEIAILRTMGAPPRLILNIFMMQGLFIGLIGTLIGLVSGLILASNATQIVNWLQDILNISPFASGVYFVDSLPSTILWQDVTKVCAIALLMSFMATLYPAWRAAKIQPAEALRYE